jgi:hypothetical protein
MSNVAPHQSSPSAPSVVWDVGRFWMTWLSDSGDNAIFFANSNDGANWKSSGTVNGQAASAPPAIALRQGKPIIVYALVPPSSSAPPTILWTEFVPEANTWTTVQRVSSGDSTSSLTAVTKSDGTLIVLSREASLVRLILPQ